MAVKRSIYLINPKFQLKFAMFVCTFVFIPFLMYPITIYELLSEIILRLDSSALRDKLIEQQSTLIITLVFIHLMMTMIVFVICIFQSHKIAGPLYKLKRFLQSIKAGNPPGHLFFRKGDNFMDIADDFNDAFVKLQTTHHNDFAYLQEVTNYIENLHSIVPDDKKVVISEITEKLKEIQQRYSNT